MSKKSQSKKKSSKAALIAEAARETTSNDSNDDDDVPNNLQQQQQQQQHHHHHHHQATPDVIAELSESILENPESAFSAIEENDQTTRKKTALRKAGPSKMRQLLQLATTNRQQQQQQQQDDDEHSAQLAILSLLAIFKDILPSYRIRLPSTKEMAVRVSKETKKLWDYERALLQHYQDYLKLLERTWEERQKKSNFCNNNSLAITAILCLCELLKSAFHFNFRSNLLTAVVRTMNHPLEQVSHACCTAVEFVFEHDAQGQVALEATRQVSKLIRERHHHFRGVQPRVLRTFLSLPLRVHVDEAQAAKLASQVNAKKRKRDKEGAEIEAELKESQATVDKIVLARCQSDTLQAVTLTYFRILKSDNLKASHLEALLPAALEGLAKFAHLINIDTVMDLLDVLKHLLKNVDALELDAALNCVLTAFQTLQGPGKELKIDQKEYIVPLYGQLPRLCSESASQRHTDTMIKCLSAAFLKRREYSQVRITAFLKQILTVAMHTPPHTSVPLLAFGQQLLQRYPSTQQMLENEQDTITSGQYNPTVEDPEHSNPFATSAWELATLRFHLNPSIASQANAAASNKMLLQSAERLRRELLQDDAKHELYIPFKRSKKRHPLAPKEEGPDKTKTRRRRQVRFIKPRTIELSLISSHEL